jgi:hypothetical protein
VDRDDPVAAGLTLHLAERRVERDAGVRQPHHRLPERLEDGRVRDVEGVRGADRVGDVERHRPHQAAGVDELAEEVGAAALEVDPPVPPGEHLAGGGEVDRLTVDHRLGLRPAQADEGVDGQLGAEHAVREHDLLELLEREALPLQPVRPRQALLHLQDAEAGAEAARGALHADDPIEALEGLLRVREPVAVVRVRDVVVAEDGGQPGGPDDAGHSGRRVRLPLAVRVAAVEDEHAELREGDPPDGRHAVLQVLVRDVGHDRVVPVERLTGRVRGDRVDPRRCCQRSRVAFSSRTSVDRPISM